ncbi:predicted protein [Arabidopsis lyrata subsp. lyrata]|uniref:Predicted protein n=1 Tax=Arabidopsis lyrata subsp. lyrata TaxID=81972 RepID=D7LPY2_ARALL|nr:predicted protein [Arabidopsis lyrata subsp. lyrata]
MNNYRLKDPTPLGKEFLVDNFNEKFNLNINYRFFKEKLDQLKKKYKKYVQLMDNTCITVDPVTHQITASNSWWKDQEVCKIVHAFQRQPPQLWDVMQRCFRLYNVKSQSQYSVNQRREEIMNEGITNNQGQTYSETYGDEIPESQVPETQENEEVYRVNIDDETRHGWSSYDDFAEVMGETEITYTNSKIDLGDMEAAEIVDGDLMTNIRENIADMLWKNQNTRY